MVLAETRASGISKQKLDSPRDMEEREAEGRFLLSHVHVG